MKSKAEIVREARALARVVEARRKMLASHDEYGRALEDAHALGVPNTRIAHELKVSETAVRLWIKRHNLDTEVK